MSSANQPNIILIMTDQHRGDCMSIAGHPVVQTPTLDWLAESGARFTSAYSACPVCVPARRTLMTGQKPATHGVLSNYFTLLDGTTLPEALRDAGYQTHLSGKLHLWPLRKAYGFESMELSDGPGYSANEGDSDYKRYLRRQGFDDFYVQCAGGVKGEGSTVRPWHLEERHHVANWATSCAIDWLERRDPTRPFFLKLSYFHPHPPIMPPQCYYDRYVNAELPEPPVGEWARIFDGPQLGRPVDSTRQALPPARLQQYRAAYYGQVNHIDDQIMRLFLAMPMMGINVDDTLIVYTSDHGDMLGDHQFTRKNVPYEASTHIPLIMRFPRAFGIEAGRTPDTAVELMDIMPTLLDAAGVPIPDTVEGTSLLPLLKGGSIDRTYVHGEHCNLDSLGSGMHYLTDGRIKYIWYPALGREELFNLVEDPQELHELVSEGKNGEADLGPWRTRLVETLAGRPEGFVQDGTLARLPGPTTRVLPGFERSREDELKYGDY